MCRSQDYMNPFWDEMFPDTPNSCNGGYYSSTSEPKKKPEESRREDSEISVSKRALPIYAAVVGDIVGSRFERDYPQFIRWGCVFPLFTDESRVTDDTVFTMGVAEALLAGEAAQQGFTKHLIEWGRKYPDAGYGRATQAWIASDDPQPYGSNRNGAAMRVSPCACFASSLDEALALAREQAEVSHNSPEGVAGAQAIAAAIYMALDGASKDDIKAYVENNFGYSLGLSMQELMDQWAGFSCKASDTVPQAIMCFLQGDSVEAAIRNAIALCSDADTLASMAAAIAAAFYGKLPMLREALAYMPADVKAVLADCDARLS